MIDDLISFKKKSGLSLAESALYQKIKQEGEFDFKNEEIQKYLGVSHNWVSCTIKKLKNLGYIYESFFDGHKRILKANEGKCIK